MGNHADGLALDIWFAQRLRRDCGRFLWLRRLATAVLVRLDAGNLAGPPIGRDMPTERREMLSGICQSRLTSSMVWTLPAGLLVDCYVVRDIAAVSFTSDGPAERLIFFVWP